MTNTSGWFMLLLLSYDDMQVEIQHISSMWCHSLFSTSLAFVIEHFGKKQFVKITGFFSFCLHINCILIWLPLGKDALNITVSVPRFERI